MEYRPLESVSKSCRRLLFFSVFSKFVMKLGFFIFRSSFLSSFFSFQMLHLVTHIIGVGGWQSLQVSFASPSTSAMLVFLCVACSGLERILVIVAPDFR